MQKGAFGCPDKQKQLGYILVLFEPGTLLVNSY